MSGEIVCIIFIQLHTPTGPSRVRVGAHEGRFRVVRRVTGRTRSPYHRRGRKFSTMDFSCMGPLSPYIVTLGEEDSTSKGSDRQFQLPKVGGVQGKMKPST